MNYDNKHKSVSSSYSSDEDDLNFCPFSNNKNATKNKSKKTTTATKFVVAKTITSTATTTISNENSPSKKFDDKSRERAKKRAENAPINRHLTDISQLQWHKPKDKRRQVYIPVRICTEDEKIGLPLTVKQGLTYCEELRCCGHAGKYDKKFSTISNSMLSPMTDTLDESKVEMWKDCYIERYENTKNDMLANEFYLQRIIDNLKKKHEQKSTEACKKSHREELDDTECNVSYSSDHRRHEEDDELDDGYDEPYTQALDVDETGIPDTAGRKKEPIRPGDVISYHDPMFVAGDKRGINEASIISVDSKRYPILTLSNGDILPPDTNIRRIRVMKRNKLEDHPFGIFRHITDFKLNKAGKFNGSVIQGKSDMLERTLQNHLNNLQDKIGNNAMGTNLLHKGYKQRMDSKRKQSEHDQIESNSEAKSFLTPTSISYSSSSSTDNSVSISSSGKKERNSYAIVDTSDDEKPLFLSHKSRTTTYLKNTKTKQEQSTSKTNMLNNMLLSSDDDDEPISVLKDTRTSNEKNMFSLPSTLSSQDSVGSAIPKKTFSHKSKTTTYLKNTKAKQEQSTSKTNMLNNMLLSSDDDDEPISGLKNTRTSNAKTMFSMQSTSWSQEPTVSAIPKKKKSILFSIDDDDESISVANNISTFNGKTMFGMPSTSWSQESAVSTIPKKKKISSLSSTTQYRKKKEFTTTTFDRVLQQRANKSSTSQHKKKKEFTITTFDRVLQQRANENKILDSNKADLSSFADKDIDDDEDGSIGPWRKNPLTTKTTPNKRKRMTIAGEDDASTSSSSSDINQHNVKKKDKNEKCSTEAKHYRALFGSAEKSPLISPSRKRNKGISSPQQKLTQKKSILRSSTLASPINTSVEVISSNSSCLSSPSLSDTSVVAKPILKLNKTKKSTSSYTTPRARLSLLSRKK